MMNKEIKLTLPHLDELINALKAPGSNEKVTVSSDKDFFAKIEELQHQMDQEFIWTPLLNGPELWKGELWRIKTKSFHENIVDYMTFDHRRCDELFALAESNWNDGDAHSAKENLDSFDLGMRAHLSKEENYLFPEFVKSTGMTGGPIHVMMMEHNQMREMLNQMIQACHANKMDDALAIGDTLLILIQQHNMKEEGMLYPMIKKHCAHLGDECIKFLQHHL